jgi:hypothetical protein
MTVTLVVFLKLSTQGVIAKLTFVQNRTKSPKKLAKVKFMKKAIDDDEMREINKHRASNFFYLKISEDERKMKN